MAFQRKVNVKFLNTTYNYTKYYGMMNATLSENGALTFFINPARDFNNAFATVGLDLSTDGSDNFNVNFLNKTIDICKLLSVSRYELLLKLVYKIVSENDNVHFPQRCPFKKVLHFHNALRTDN